MGLTIHGKKYDNLLDQFNGGILHIKRLKDPGNHISGSLAYEKNISKMGAAFAHNYYKCNCVTTSKNGLALFDRIPNDFLRCFITVNDTWIHYDKPEIKQLSKKRVFLGESAPKRAKVGQGKSFLECTR